jgi:WD40 repeat protein
MRAVAATLPTRAALGLLLWAAAGCSPAPGHSDALEMAAQGLYAGALSPRSELALVGSLNHGASLWRTADRARLYNWNHRQDERAALVAAAFSADGSRAVTTDPRTLVVWDTQSGSALASWATPGTVLDVALARDGRRVLMGLDDHSAVLFDAESGSHLHTLLHDGVVGSVALSADGRWALTGSDDGAAVLWEAGSGDAVHVLEHDNPVRVVALSAAGRYAFTASQGRRVAVWNGATGERLLSLAERNRGVTAARFSPDERFLLVGYVNRAVELWDVVTGQRVQRWHLDGRHAWRPPAVLAVGFSASPERFYALAGDGRLLELRRS